jgi:hypothetical protein
MRLFASLRGRSRLISLHFTVPELVDRAVMHKACVVLYVDYWGQTCTQWCWGMLCAPLHYQQERCPAALPFCLLLAVQYLPSSAIPAVSLAARRVSVCITLLFENTLCLHTFTFEFESEVVRLSMRRPVVFKRLSDLLMNWVANCLSSWRTDWISKR